MRLTPRPRLLSLAKLHSKGRKGRVRSDGDHNCSGVDEILNRILQSEAFVRRMTGTLMEHAEQVWPKPHRKGVGWWANLRECQKMGNPRE